MDSNTNHNNDCYDGSRGCGGVGGETEKRHKEISGGDKNISYLWRVGVMDLPIYISVKILTEIYNENLTFHCILIIQSISQ